MNKGFTLIEMLIVIVITAIVLGVVGASIGSCNGYRANAEVQAREHVGRLHPTWTNLRLDCQNWDSDNNGYVRCTVVATEANRDVEMDLECAAYWFWSFNKGCQTPRAVISTWGTEGRRRQ